MRILDIGGGFCAAFDPATRAFSMGGVPAAVNAALDAHFPGRAGVCVIAEPGRYFAEAPSTLACMVYGVRDGAPSSAPPGGAVTRDYWITDGALLAKWQHLCMTSPSWNPCHESCVANPLCCHVCTWLLAHAAGWEGAHGNAVMCVMTEPPAPLSTGLYGSMNSLLYDHATVAPRPLRLSPGPALPKQGPAAAAAARTGDVFGPSCDGLDTVLRGYALPELDVGDWLVFGSHGAYTFTGACPFNGMDPTPATFYVFSLQ